MPQSPQIRTEDGACRETIAEIFSRNPYIFNFSSPNKLLTLIEVSKYNEKVILKQFCT